MAKKIKTSKTSKTNKSLKASYDAVTQKTRRRANVTNLRHEDEVLKAQDRDKLISEARLLRRNAAVVAWAVRKHLDYVSTFSFQCRTGHAELDERIESLMSWWSKPLNCDVAGRHSLQRLIRLAEGLATTDGDAFIMKLSDGRIQLIEGDRIRNPHDLGEFKGEYYVEDFKHGIQTTDAGRALRYAICDRSQNRFVLRSVIESQHVLQHGYFDRADQVRGISPLASAINSFCDVYEASEYALAKMKLSQIFGLKMKLAGDADESEEPYSFDFGSGPQVITLGEGDDADFLESKTPSTEFQSFLQAGIAIGLKSLDLPYSFFDESHTNYSGARQALLMYEQSASQKRQVVKQLLTNLTIWRIGLWIADGYLVLPDGMSMIDLNFEWISAALPWIDPLKEASANKTLIDLKLTSRQKISKERGEDWYEICDQLAEEEDYLRSKGLPVSDVDTTALDELIEQQEAEQANEMPRRKAG